MRAETPSAVPLAWGFSGLTVAVFALIVLGALVRANGAGLACPDWPLCFGQLVPRFDMRVAFEWSHRALAGLISIGLLALSLGLWRRRELLARVSRALGIAWLLLGVQVVLGGLTVLLMLSPWTVTAHLLTGTAFCVALLWIARDLFEPPPTAADPGPDSGYALAAALATAVVVVLQFLLGGWVSSHGAGLACASFPLCDGVSFAPRFDGMVGIQVLHRLNGVAVAICFAALMYATRALPRARWLVWTGLRLVIFQIALGGLNVLLQLPPELTGLHTALGAAIALLTALVVRDLWPARWAGAAQPVLDPR